MLIQFGPFMIKSMLAYADPHRHGTSSTSGAAVVALSMFAAGLALGIVALCFVMHGGRVLLPVAGAYAGAVLCSLIGLVAGICTCRQRTLRKQRLGMALNILLLLSLMGTPLIIAFVSSPPTPAVRGP
jgi:hypothetical protein